MPSLVRLSDPAVEPVSIHELRAYARITNDAENETLWSAIRTAREAVERMTGRSLITQTWQATFDNWFPDVIRLRMGPVQSITSLEYVDTDGATQVLSSYHADLISEPARLQPAWNDSWPVTREQLGAVTVEYIAGYGSDPISVPEPLKDAILDAAAYRYDNRGGMDMQWLSGLVGNHAVIDL